MTTFMGQCATQTPPTSQGVSCLLARTVDKWSQSAFRGVTKPRTGQPYTEQPLAEVSCVEELCVDASAEKSSTVDSSIEVDPLAETRQQVFDLQGLLEGWNGYDALPPSRASVDLVAEWLNLCFVECQDKAVRWHAPVVTAGAEGEVMLIWRTGNFTLTAQAQVCLEGEQYVEFYTHTAGQSERDEQEDALDSKMRVKMLRDFNERMIHGRV